MLRITLAAALLATSIAAAEEKDETLMKQKQAAEAAWKRLELEKPQALVETANLLTYSRLTDAKTKSLTTALEKQFTAMTKALKFEDRPWPGKATLFVLTSRDEFVSYMRKVEKKSAEDEMSSLSIKGDDVVIAIGPSRGEKVEPEGIAREYLANALIQRKMGAGEAPSWIVEGFAAAAAYRAANPMSKARNPSWRPPAVPLASIWMEGMPAKPRLVFASYVMDYFAFGPLAEQFPTFITGLRPDEGGMPNLDEALKGVGLDVPTLELYARNWVKPKAPAKPPTKSKPGKGSDK